MDLLRFKLPDTKLWTVADVVAWATLHGQAMTAVYDQRPRCFYPLFVGTVNERTLMLAYEVALVSPWTDELPESDSIRTYTVERLRAIHLQWWTMPSDLHTRLLTKLCQRPPKNWTILHRFPLLLPEAVSHNVEVAALISESRSKERVALAPLFAQNAEET